MPETHLAYSKIPPPSKHNLKPGFPHELSAPIAAVQVCSHKNRELLFSASFPGSRTSPGNELSNPGQPSHHLHPPSPL